MVSSGIRKRTGLLAGGLLGVLLIIPLTLSAQENDPKLDAWGAKRSFGMAVGETMLSNLVPWAFNEFIRDAPFSQVNPTSWVHNFEAGMGWDDNHFSTNQFAHPYQGSMYFNSARANGFNFWQSAPWAFAGSIKWECCGETHLMSVNDFVNTGMGGMALGEMIYRTSSLVLDNQATGSERAWNEFWGFVLSPLRGFNRLVTGRSRRVYDNPTDPLDHRPVFLANRLHAGVRGFAQNAGFTDPKYKAFLNLEYLYGSPFSIERNKPWEFFILNAQINFGDTKALGKLNIHANLFHKDLGERGRDRHRFMVLQHFDYVNNSAYELGGQSVGAGVLSTWELGEPGNWRLFTLGEGIFWPMVAVSSEFAYAAEIPGTRENLRSYDYGLGAGARVGTAIIKDQTRIVDLLYSVNYVNTLNGSVANGSDSWHIIHSALVRTLIPVKEEWALGFDYELFLRHSYFSTPEFEDQNQRSPQLRAFVSWKLGQSGSTGFGS